MSIQPQKRSTNNSEDISKGQIEKQILQQVEHLAAIDPNLGYDASMLPTADMSQVVLPILREHIGFTRLTKTRSLGNGYLVYDDDTEQWRRSEGLSEKWVLVTDEIRTTLTKLLEQHRGQHQNDNSRKIRQVLQGAMTSAKQMRKGNYGFVQVIVAAKPELKLSGEFLMAQNFKWLLSLCNDQGEIEAIRMSALNDLNTESGYIGGLDWNKHIAIKLKEMDLVRPTNNRPLIRLDKDEVRAVLEDFVNKHDV